MLNLPDLAPGRVLLPFQHSRVFLDFSRDLDRRLLRWEFVGTLTSRTLPFFVPRPYVQECSKMNLRLCCVSSRIEGVPDDFFFVIFVISFLQMMQIATSSS